VAQSKVLTLRVLEADRVYWRRGEDPWARTDLEGLTNVFKPLAGNKELVVLIQIDREAKFRNMVEVIDELDVAQLTRFSLTTLEPDMKKEVEAL
jgi:biopolymer transport protein ExbD